MPAGCSRAPTPSMLAVQVPPRHLTPRQLRSLGPIKSPPRGSKFMTLWSFFRVSRRRECHKLAPTRRPVRAHPREEREGSRAHHPNSSQLFSPASHSRLSVPKDVPRPLCCWTLSHPPPSISHTPHHHHHTSHTMAVSSISKTALRRAMAGNTAFNGARTYASKTAVSPNISMRIPELQWPCLGAMRQTETHSR